LNEHLNLGPGLQIALPKATDFQNINADLVGQLGAVRAYRFLIVLLFFLLLLAPVLLVHDLTEGSIRSLGLVSRSSPSLVSASTQLLPGQANLVGSVDVRKLPGTGLSSGGQNAVPNLHPQGAQAFDLGKNETAQPGYVPPGESSKTVTTAQVSPQTSSAIVNLVLEGASGGSPNPCGCTPPDPNDAVGPNHVFETVNLAGIIYLKNGTIAKSTFPLSAFFNLSGTMSDPQVLYDAISGRWFASIIDISGNNVQIAVSTGNDPTGIFNLYSVSVGTNLPDQPYIGTSDDKFVIAANDYASVVGPYLGVQYWIMNKAELVNGSSTVDFSTNTPDSSMFTLRPVRHLTSTSEFYMATNCIGSCVSNSLTTTSTVELVTVSGVPPGTVAVATKTFSISTSVSPPNAIQPGTRTALVTNDNRILSAVWESNNLWLSWADACKPSGDTTTRSCVRLVQATTYANGTVVKNQDFDYASKGEYLFYPAVALYHGQLAVVYGKSSASLYPSIFVTGRLPSDVVNSLENPATIKTGTTPDLSGRYGDYFGAGTDPAPTDNSTFWVSGEYRASSVTPDWNTVIAQVGGFAPDFALSANPSSITMLAGVTGNSTITVAGYRLTGNIRLNVTVSPTGLSCTLNPSTVVLGTSATSRLSCVGSEGDYNMTLTGASGSLSHSVLVPATVQPSQSVGGIILPVDRARILLSFVEPSLAVLMVFLLGLIVSRQIRGKRFASLSHRQRAKRTS
jgi:hypothetical protein